ncbi:MAG TPA: hypothetical protein VLC07_02630, partial [Solirubrobacterales bacterium]|nr:hypothetical protein [Solirubrobacterales bacterium]
MLKSRIPEIVAGSVAKTRAAVEVTVFNIEAGCKLRSRVDTGQMQNGWTGEMTGAAEGIVYNPVEHTIFNELGTVDMAAQPMLAPSVEEARGPFL